jgi:dihydropteroate synthase
MYWQPIAQNGVGRPSEAPSLAGGLSWFEQVLQIQRGKSAQRVPWRDIPADVLKRLTEDRPTLCGMTLDRPRVMGILNVTPDSFSDGGQYDRPDMARLRAEEIAEYGVDLLDIGGESTRPGAAFVPAADEIARVIPVIEQVADLGLPISIDTRKASVAKAALAAGAAMVNDVSGLCFDPDMTALVAQTGVPICIMHAQGDPKTMQTAPQYDDVLLDVYDWLDAQITTAEAAGISRAQIVIDPGIGFGKTLEHNLTLLKGLSLFHGLGCPILLGVSRKRFIGVIGNAPEPAHRLAGSLALALDAAAQGVQILRVHDTRETVQALALRGAVRG